MGAPGHHRGDNPPRGQAPAIGFFSGTSPFPGTVTFDTGVAASYSFVGFPAGSFWPNFRDTGLNVTINATSPTVTLFVTTGAGFGGGTGNRFLRSQRVGASGAITSVGFASNSGLPFNLQSIALQAGMVPNTDKVVVTITGYLSGTLITSYNTGVINDATWPTSAISTPGFTAIDSFAVTAVDQNSGVIASIGVDAINIGTPPILVNNPALSNGQAGVAYTGETFTASGGTSPYTFAKISGTLPPGLTLSSTGSLSGTPTAVGTFNFTVQATDAASKTSVADPVSVTITPPTLTLTPVFLSDATYQSTYATVTFSAGGGNTPYTYTAVGLPPGITINASNGQLTGKPTAAGTYAVAVTATDNTTGVGSPFQTTNNITWVVDKAPLTVTAVSTTKAYGAALPTFTANYSGFVGGDNTTSLTTQANFSTSATAASPVGTYTITPSGVVDPNYAITYVGGTLQVTPVALTITPNNATMPYGGPIPTLTAAYSGFVNGDNASSLSPGPTVATTATTSSTPGTFPITASGAADPNYTISYGAPGTLTVTQATLTITANDNTMTYGGAVPALSVMYSGFVNGDNSSVLTAQPTTSTTATNTSVVGTYPITATGAAAANYTISYVPGTMTVGPATLTVTGSSPTKVYGAAVPALGVTYSGFVGSDNAGSLATAPTATTTATAASPVGVYPVTPSGGVAANYTFNYVPGSLTVTTATLDVTAVNNTMQYGGPFPGLSVVYSGFVNGDNASSLSVAPSIASTAGPSSPVGVYTLTPMGAVDPNYTFVYNNGTLTITPAPLTITAANASMVYGSAVPTLSANYSGFVNGDNASNLSTAPTVTTTATSASPVGIYPITASGAVDPNYTISYVSGTMTVTKATLTVTADDKQMPLGGPLPALTISYSGFVNGDNAGSLTVQPTASTSATAGSPAGNYTISVSGGSSPNYNLSYVNGTLTVQKATLTITALPASSQYGSPLVPNGNLQVSYSGFVHGDNSSSMTVPPIVINTAFTGAPVGTYALIPSGAVNPNYNIVYVDGTYSVTPAPLLITPVNATMPYGGPVPAMSATYSGFVNGDNAASLTIAPVLSTNAIASSPVGVYLMSASGAVDPNYVITYGTGTLTVTPAPLTITAGSTSMTYGGTVPALSASYSGFVNGDNAASLTTQPTLATTATSLSPIGTYPTTASGAVDPNYTISYVPGVLTVGQAVLNITANDASMTYGGALPTLGVTYSGFVNGDNASSLSVAPTISTTGTSASPAGVYPITASGAADPNYTITYTPGTLTIGNATLNITAGNNVMTYGGAVPSIGYAVTGFVNGDGPGSFTATPTITTTATSSSPVGTYPTTASGAVINNYTIVYNTGTMTVQPAALTVTASDATMPYGGPLPAFGVTYSGFVNGDNASSLTTAPVIASTATTASPVGTYPITASGAVDPNYTITYVPGTLTVGAAALTITASNASMTYGGTVPALGVTYSGFVNGDNASSLTTAPLIASTATSASPVGVYPITASGAVDPNYTITYVPGMMTVGPAALTITASNASMTYGGPLPAFGVVYSGFMNGDNAASLTTPPAIATTATSASPVGTYPITPSAAVDPNYTITYASGVLTVGPAALTITAANASMTYGGTVPAIGVSYSGFLNGDNASSLTTPPVTATTATAASPVGTYPTTASGAVSPNYTISYVPGVLTVGPAALTITAADASRYEGQANPAFTVNYSGFVNGDNASALTTQPSLSTTATIASPAGTYPIVPSGAAATNYTFTYVDGTLTVIALMPNVITFNSLPAKTYGDADFAISATASSGLAVTLASLDNSVATVYQSGSGQWMVHIVSAGQVLIAATQAGGTPYAAATEVDQNLVINRASQVIVFPNPSQFTPTTGTTLTLNAVASSGLPITYSTSDPTVATVTGNQLTITGTGSVVVTASQPGSMNYLPAAPVSDTLQPYDQRGFHDGVGVFPNPAHGTLYIHLSEGYIVTKITMFDLHGRVVAGEFDVTNNSSTIPLDISHLLPGIYILNVVCERNHQIAYPFFKILVE